MLDALKPWQGFYQLVGTASATLVGLMFVAAAVGSGVYRRDKHHALRAFLSPTVVHFSGVLMACLIATMPITDWRLGGLLIGGEGLFGLLYASTIWRNLIRHGLMTSIDREDRLWYAALPACSYLVLMAAGIALLSRSGVGCELLAAGLCLLLLTGIRNAWDMTLWTVMRHGD